MRQMLEKDLELLRDIIEPCGGKMPTIKFDESDPKPWNVKMFRTIANELAELYERKNADYGDSFSNGIDRFGFQSALGIIYNKFCRCENLLLKSDIQVKDESIQDTLRDISVYCIQLAMYLNNKREKSSVDFEIKE